MTSKIAILFTAAVACLAQPPDHMFMFQTGVPGGADVKKHVFFVNIDEAGPMVGGQLVTGAPFTARAVTESIQSLADGNRIVHTSTTDIARDSKGRIRREESLGGLAPLPAAETKKIVFLDDPANKTQYVLDAETKTARKTSASSDSKVAAEKMMRERGVVVTQEGRPGEPGAGVTFTRQIEGTGKLEAEIVAEGMSTRMRHVVADGPEGEKANVEQLGTQTIEGVTATGTRTTMTIPAGAMGNERPISIVSERWYSPDLKMVVLSKRSDPRMGETTYKLTEINRSEPPASMFEVPADYTTSEGPFIYRKSIRTTEPTK